MVKIELVYVAQEGVIFHLKLDLSKGATVNDALLAAKIHQLYPETKNLAVGIYSKKVDLDLVLKDGDRVEIYRPLTLDPKEKRRQKARLKKSG